MLAAKKDLVEVAEKERGLSSPVYYQALDVTESQGIDAFVEQAAQVLGGLDILVNNVGGNRRVAFADSEEAKHEYNVDLLPSLDDAAGYHCVVGAVSHDVYAGYGPADFARLLADDGVVADVKGMWRELELPETYRRWQL